MKVGDLLVLLDQRIPPEGKNVLVQGERIYFDMSTEWLPPTISGIFHSVNNDTQTDEGYQRWMYVR